MPWNVSSEFDIYSYDGWSSDDKIAKIARPHFKDAHES